MKKKFTAKPIKASEDKTILKLEYYPDSSGFGGGDTGLRKVTISGDSLMEALKKMVDRLSIFLDSDMIDDEGMTTEDVIEAVHSSNDDGCGFITLLKNESTGEIYISEDYEEPQEDYWY